jgi:hypothetical protein
MTGTEIITFTETILISDKIKDEGKLLLINHAIRDISRQAPYLDIVSITFLANGTPASLPSMFKMMEKLGNNLKYIHPAKIPDLTATGEPSNYYYIGLDKIKVYPIPLVDTTLTAIVRRGYPELTTLDSEPSIIPADYHEMICYYIAWVGSDYFGNNLVTQQKFETFRNEYFRMLAEYKQMVDTCFYEYEGLKTEDVLPKSSRWI